jgi:hypothetical protein
MRWLFRLPVYKRVTVVAGAVSALVGALLAVANAAGVAEPLWIATRGFTRDTVEAAVQRSIGEMRRGLSEAQARQIGIEIRIVAAERRRLQDRIADLALELQKNPAAPETLRRAIDEQIRDMREDLQDSDEAMRELRRQQGRRP